MKVLYLFQVVSVVFFISVGGFIVQCLIRDFFDFFSVSQRRTGVG